MITIQKIKAWLNSGRVGWGTLIAVIIFLSSVVSDQLLHWQGIRGSQTYINDLFLAGMAGLLEAFA